MKISAYNSSNFYSNYPRTKVSFRGLAPQKESNYYSKSISMLKSTINTGFGEDYTPKRAQKTFFNALDKISSGGVESSNVEMIMDLIKAGKLPSHVLMSVEADSKVSKNVEDDLDRLWFCYERGLKEEDVFVPDFSSKEEALDEIPVGEVCKIKGDDTISIKADDNELLELSLTKKDYLKLFPPVERFICTQSFEVGDCYFLSSLDSINQNPYKRAELLKMFKSNPNGKISTAYRGFEIDDIGYMLKNYNPKRISRTLPAFQALEIAYELSYKVQAQEKFDDYLKLIRGFKRALQENKPIQDPIILRNYEEGFIDDFSLEYIIDSIPKDSVYYNDNSYTKDEIEAFLTCYETKGADEFVSLAAKKSIALSKDEIKDMLKELEGKNDFFSNYSRLVLERMQRNTFSSHSSVLADEYIPKEVYCFLTRQKHFNYVNYGIPSNVYKQLGFESENIRTNRKHLVSSDVKKVYSASVGENNKTTSFITKHAYSINPVDDKIVVRNPHNTTFEKAIPQEKLHSDFDYLSFGK